MTREDPGPSATPTRPRASRHRRGAVRRVVVVGAGPAGSSAAMALAPSSAIETILLERRAIPRVKVCGSGLSPWTLDYLDTLGVGAAVRRAAHPIHGAIVAGSTGPGVELRGPREAAIMARVEFDTLLADEAARRGADVRAGVRVRAIVKPNGRVFGVDTDDGFIEADAVIDATGARDKLSAVPKNGMDLHTIMGWYEGVEGISNVVELYFDALVRPHYGWIFPEAPGRVNIGLCFLAQPGSSNARERFAGFLDERLGRRMAHAVPLGKWTGHPVHTTVFPRALSSEGVLVAGEAGRLVDSATAEGIYHALVSGTEAGSFLRALRARGMAPSAENLSPYTAMIRKKLGVRLASGRLLATVLKMPVLDTALRWSSIGVVRAALTRAFIGLYHG